MKWKAIRKDQISSMNYRKRARERAAVEAKAFANQSTRDIVKYLINNGGVWSVLKSLWSNCWIGFTWVVTFIFSVVGLVTFPLTVWVWLFYVAWKEKRNALRVSSL